MRDSLETLYDARLTREGWRDDPAQRAVLPRLEALRGWLEAHGAPPRHRGPVARLFARPAVPPRGVYLWGPVGRGKSMLMDLFHEATAIDAKRRVHFHAFMQEIQHALHAARQAGAEDALRPVAESVIARLRLLCFDEMQITDIADAMIVGRLFERLLDGGVVIVTTSNRPPEDLYKDGLNRPLFEPFIALMRDRLEVLALTGGADYRRTRSQGGAVWFTPAGPAQAAQIGRIWRGLTGAEGDEAAALRLDVEGRTVELGQFREGVARVRFWDLCGRPLGPADYLALAEAVKVLILEDIPYLSAANYNEAKRFVTLVDTLYEARVRLIASAADRPERLYVEGAGSFEFARTVSRLAEMQAEDWGQEPRGA